MSPPKPSRRWRDRRSEVRLGASQNRHDALVIEGFTPVWKMPSRLEAIEILQTCRSWTDDNVSRLTVKQRELPTPLGDGTWSVKDLLGHLATHEHRALVLMGARTPEADDETQFTDIATFNEHHREKKAVWSLANVEREYATTRDEFVNAIAATSDERWVEKIPSGRGRSALALVLAKALNGDKYGYFAHDLAHGRGLVAAIAALTPRHA
jgi:hypothetical protein